MTETAKPIFSYGKYRTSGFAAAPFLPMSRAEMDALGWDSCDVIVVTGDAYVDHPSFGPAVIARALCYFEGGDLAELPEDDRRTLETAVATLADLPEPPPTRPIGSPE